MFLNNTCHVRAIGNVFGSSNFHSCTISVQFVEDLFMCDGFNRNSNICNAGQVLVRNHILKGNNYDSTTLSGMQRTCSFTKQVLCKAY